jgi:uncharacterized membrane protein YphA (DoxX/SURF4 family)
VTEVLQPLAAPAATPAPIRPGHKTAAHSHDPSFTELVYAHFAWWQELRGGAAGDAAAAYHEMLVRFEQRHGRLVQSFWCTHLESAVALTEQPGRFRWQRSRCSFHRESDWATKGRHEIAAQLHRCDELAVRARTVLTGVRQRICLQLVTASAAHLLSLVDESTSHADRDNAAVLKSETAALDATEAYYRQAANGQAQIIYFAGMATVAAVISAVAGIALAFGWMSGVAALIAGAIGAVVSVVQRINAGQFELDYDVGRPYAFFLGGLRPLIGGAFALAITFAFTSGLLHLPISAKDPESDHKLAVFVVGFLAGFSERWAQDTLTTALPAAAGPAPAKAAADALPKDPPTP